MLWCFVLHCTHPAPGLTFDLFCFCFAAVFALCVVLAICCISTSSIDTLLSSCDIFLSVFFLSCCNCIKLHFLVSQNLQIALEFCFALFYVVLLRHLPVCLWQISVVVVDGLLLLLFCWIPHIVCSSPRTLTEEWRS